MTAFWPIADSHERRRLAVCCPPRATAMGRQRQSRLAATGHKYPLDLSP